MTTHFPRLVYGLSLWYLQTTSVISFMADIKQFIVYKAKDRQYNDPKKKYKRIINDLQSITQKTKDRATRISLQCRIRLNN
jgi:hypothetical protein